MAQWRITDNTRETFVGANSTTITLGGAAQNSRSFAGASWASGDFGPIVARAGAEIAAGIFTYNGTSFAQTTPLYTSNSNAAVPFSSGAQGEVYCDLLAAWVELINFTEISVASAATCDIGGTAVQGAKVVISGTTTITLLGTGTNKFRLVRFSGILTLTHNATSLILPGGVNITTAAGDTAIFLSDSTGNWRCWAYQPAAGYAALARPNAFTDATEATGAGTTAAAIFSGGVEMLKKLFVTGIGKFTAGLATPVAPTTGPHLDTSAMTAISIANGGNALISDSQSSYYLLFIVETTQNGNTALYALRGAGVVDSMVVSGAWVSTTTTPAAGKQSVAWSGTQFRIYNNSGGTATFKCCLIKVA